MNLAAFPLRLAGAACLAFTAAPAAAGTNPSTAPSSEPSEGNGAAPAAEAKPAEEKRICRRIEATESRMKTQRVCLTREEWRRAKF